MAELILPWLNNLKLSKKVTCIEKDFSNGFLFGEILLRLKQLDSTTDFVNAHTPAARVNNFTLLEPVLRRLDIRLDINKIQLIVEEQEGAALQLLYQIKVAISTHSKNCGRTLSDISRVISTEKPPYEAAQKKFLDERLRKLIWAAKNESSPAEETLPGGRSRPKGKAEVDCSPAGQQRDNPRSPLQVERRPSRENHRKQETHAQDGRRSPAAKVHVAPIAKQPLSTTKARTAKLSQEVQKGIAQFEMNLQRLGLDITSSTAATTRAATDEFPVRRTLQNLEAELFKRLPSSTCCHENAKMMERLHEARAAQETARKEREKRRQKLLMEQNQARAASAAAAVEGALVEKMHRRSKRAAAIRYKLGTVKQYQAIIETNRTLREAQYVEKRQSHEVAARQRTSYARSVVQESLCREVHLEAAQCRALKKQLHAAKRARLIEECLGVVDLIVDMVAAACLHTQQHDTAVIDSRTWRDWLIAFVEGVSALSVISNKQTSRAATESNLFVDPSQSVLHLSGPCVAGSVLQLHCPQGQVETSPAPVEVESAEMEIRLNEDDFFVYLNGESQWQVHANAEQGAGGETFVEDSLKGVPTSEVFKEVLKGSDALYPGAAERLKSEVPTNPNGEPALHQLGSVVSSLFDLCHTKSPMACPTDIPDCPLRIVITGKPFAGKYTLAKKLGERFKLHVIHFVDLLKEVLALQHNALSYMLEDGESTVRGSVLPSVSALPLNSNSLNANMLRLATEAQSGLREGEKLSNKLCVDLCVAKIQELFLPGALDNVKELLRHVPVKEQPEPTNTHKNEKASAGSARKGQKAPPTAKDKTSPAKETPDESTQQKLGWILVDFPQSYEQCVLLEERLSGYVTPDRLPASELSRKKAQASFVIPLPEQPHTPQSLVEGGVDVHFVLDIATEDVLMRARGTSVPEKTRDSVTIETKTPDRIEQCAALTECLRPQATVSVADECCYIEEEQKVARLFLNLFGVPEQPRLQVLNVKSDIEVLAATSRIIGKVVDRKRRELDQEVVRDLCATADAVNDLSSEPTGTCEDPSPLLASLVALEHDTQTYLMAKWGALEEEYNATMMKLFAWVRRTRREFSRGLVDLQVHFGDLLQRPDTKQEIVEAFFVEYNSFVSSVAPSFHLDAIKEEMHLQVDELAESLWQQIDTRRKEATTEHKRLVETGWLEVVCLVISAQLEALVEAELKRYLALEEFATDTYYSLLNACVPESRRPTLNSSVLKEAAQRAVKQAFAWLCNQNQKTSNQDNSTHKPWQTHIFEQLEAKAKEHLVPLTEFEEYIPVSVEVDKKKPTKTKLPVKEETKTREEPQLHVELQQTRLELQVQLLCRLRRLCLWGATRVHEATKAGNDIFGRLDDWIIARSLAEHAAVRELVTRIKYYIENERQIPHAMTLSGTQLILEPNALLGELEDEEVSHCALLIPPTSAFTIVMLRSFMSDIKLVATKGLISVEALREIIMRRVTHFKCFRTPTLPQTWLNTPAPKLTHIPNYFEISGGYVDAIEFLLSLTFGSTGWPSNRQLLEICCAVHAASSDAAVTKLETRGGAAPLEFFISREEFENIDYGDWLADLLKGEGAYKTTPDDPAGGCITSAEDAQQQGHCSPQQLEKNARTSLLSFLFDIFISFQGPLKSCREEADALQSLGFWAEADTLPDEQLTPSSAARMSLTAYQQQAFDQRGVHEVYVRKLLGYLALGSSPGEGLHRLLAISVERRPYVTAPMLKQEDFLSVYDLYMTCLGVGVRPSFQPIPLIAKVPLSSFCKMVRTDGKCLGPSTSSQENISVTQRVNVLEFLNSGSCTHVLLYSGPYFIGRALTTFL